jgi:hypothetical protein
MANLSPISGGKSPGRFISSIFSRLNWGFSSKRNLSMVSKNEETAFNGFGPNLAPLLDDCSPTEMIDESL